MKHKDFLLELEKRLLENQKLEQGSPVPKRLMAWTSYFGFHHFRGLFFGSLLAAILSFGFFGSKMFWLGKLIFRLL